MSFYIISRIKYKMDLSLEVTSVKTLFKPLFIFPIMFVSEHRVGIKIIN